MSGLAGPVQRSNPYARMPLCIAQVDPATGRHSRAFVFLGSAPRAVLEAARRGARAAATAGRKHDARIPVWSAADAATLSAYYGSDWRTLLTPADPPAAAGIRSAFAPGMFDLSDKDLAIGGAGRFGDLSDIDRESSGQSNPDEDDFLNPKTQFTPPRTVNYVQGLVYPPMYTDIAVYPEDNFEDLRAKLCAASNIPIWRTHIFYYTGLREGRRGAASLEGPYVPYRITLDSVQVPVDWRALAPQQGPAIAGLPVDPVLEERREGLRIESLDLFTALAPAAADGEALALARVAAAYFVDLSDAISEPAALAAALRDRYQFDLLYYGGILRYWPLLSPDACSRALGGGAGNAALAESYPELAPDPAALRERFALERAAADAALAWRPPPAGRRAAVAVAAAVLRVQPAGARMRVTVRNVFDWLATSATVLAARVRFDAEGAPLVAVKRHTSSFLGPLAPAVAEWAARPPRADTVAFALARPTGEATDAAGRLAVLTVGGDGHFEIAADWREDDRVSFADARGDLLRAATPLLRAVNEMHAAAFPIGGELVLTGGGALGGITASAYWPLALSAAAFRELKLRFVRLERAGVIRSRGAQLSGVYQFAFVRGVTAYDRRALGSRDRRDRPTALAYNQYARLTDADSAARWAAAYPGRTIRIYHRATDLQIEISRAGSLAEFELIRRYLFAFLDSERALARAPARAVEAEAPRRLRRLQERDPQLFDLKRHGATNAVYSVLCQAGRQPHVYSREEAAALSAKSRAALTAYWNFTEGVPAYYGCPSAEYPHLSFRAGAHPLGYCLPCCKKARAPAGSRAATVNGACIASAQARARGDTAAAADAAAAAARHVLAYGKALQPGRLGELPREVTGGLFLGSEAQLLAVGVPQATPGVPNAGFAFALARACDVENPLDQLAAAAAASSDFFALGAGAAAFPSAAALAAELRRAFIAQDPAPGPFSPGGAAAADWPDLLTALARAAFGVETIVLFDAAGTGVISLEATASSAVAITNAVEGARPPIIILLASPAGVYPVAAFGGRRPPTESLAGADWRFSEGSPVAGALAAALAATRATRTPAHPNCALMVRFCAARREWKLSRRLANLRGQIYAVLLERNSHSGFAYIPVAYSPAVVDGSSLEFGPAPKVELPVAELDAAIQAINEFIRTDAEFAPLLARSDPKAAPVVDDAGNTIGYTVACDNNCPRETYYYYHSSLPAPSPADSRAVYFPYDPRAVDAAIAAMRLNSKTEDDAVAALAEAADARHRIYPLLLSEFAAALGDERNTELRGEIDRAVAAARFGDAHSTGVLRARLSELLAPWPDDTASVRTALARAYTEATGKAEKINERARAIIEATPFTFDRLALARLQNLGSHAETAAAVRRLLAPRVAAATAALPANMYVSCAATSALPQPQCARGKLAVPAADLAGFYDCLAADIRNPSKAALLNAAAAGVIDPATFIRRPDELLVVHQLI